jgi:beta-N-acetylhexosaminidase
MNLKYVAFVVIFFITLNCIGQSNPIPDTITSPAPNARIIPKVQVNALAPASSGRVSNRNYKLADFYTYNIQLDKVVDSIYNNFSADQRAAQMIMPASGMNNFGESLKKLQTAYASNKIGGILFLKGTSTYFKNQKNGFDKQAQTNNLPPLMYSCDGEPALFHYKFMDQPKMIPAEKQATVADVTRESGKAVRVLKQIGININFAPLADNNINRAIISNRSFGNTAAQIVPKATAFIANHQQNGMVSVIKHFPGHGNVKGDSHIGLVKINGELTEVNTFATLIRSVKPIGVMVGHIAVDNNAQYNTNNEPATLSYKIVTGLLKNTLDFDGIAFTDAMNMGAVNKIKDADYKAACAGNDVILMPLNIDVLHAKIKSDLVGNTLKGKQFEKSIKRIIRLKVVSGLM